VSQRLFVFFSVGESLKKRGGGLVEENLGREGKRRSVAMLIKGVGRNGKKGVKKGKCIKLAKGLFVLRW